METDGIIKKFIELSREKLEDDTIKLLETMPEQELWGVLIQTRYREREIKTEATYLAEMEDYLKLVFRKRLMINTDTLQINFVDEDDGTE